MRYKLVQNRFSKNIFIDKQNFVESHFTNSEMGASPRKVGKLELTDDGFNFPFVNRVN